MFEIETIMTTDVVTIHHTEALAKARRLMRERRIRHLPVVNDEGNCIGLLTSSDVLAATDSQLRDPDERIRPSDIPVSDVMVTEVVTVDPRASLRRAALFMEKHKIGCLPVVVDEKLVGIITDTDFVGVAINLLEQLEQTEPEEDIVDE